jgi:RNA polymerase sigma-70 factor, ECF subfamily
MNRPIAIEIPACGEQAARDCEDGRVDYASLLRQHQTQLFGYIYSLVRDLDDADDLFQQTSLVLWDKFDQFDRSKSFINWACGVARFEVLNFLRTRSRKRLYFSDELNLALVEAHESLEHDRLEERRTALAGCMKKLRQKDRELLEACYERSASLRDVAHTQGRSTHSIHNSLRRIRRVLFQCVERGVARGAIS